MAIRVVRTTRLPRAALVVESTGPPLRIRCFEPAAIAALIGAAMAGPSPETPTLGRRRGIGV